MDFIFQNKTSPLLFEKKKKSLAQKIKFPIPFFFLPSKNKKQINQMAVLQRKRFKKFEQKEKKNTKIKKEKKNASLE